MSVNFIGDSVVESAVQFVKVMENSTALVGVRLEQRGVGQAREQARE